MMDISELIPILCFSLHQHRTTKTNSNESDTMKISFFLSTLALLYRACAASIEEGDEGVVPGKPVPPVVPNCMKRCAVLAKPCPPLFVSPIPET